MNGNARRYAPFAGYLLVALIVAALVLPGSPSSSASGAKVIAFYQHHKTAVHVQDFLLAYAALAGVVYFVALASYLRSRGSQLLATTTIGGAVLMAAGLCIGAGLGEALADRPAHLSDASAQTLSLLSNDAFGFPLFAGLTLAMLSAGVAMLRTRALPKALGVITTIVGVGAATGVGSWFAFLLTGPLTLVTAVYLYQRFDRPAQITMPDAIPAQATPTPKARAKA